MDDVTDMFDEGIEIEIGDDGERLDGLDDLTDGQWSDMISDEL